MKLKYPPGILGGILKYGFNPTAVFTAWFSVFAVRDAERMRLKREARLQRESEEQNHVETENHDGHHRQSGD